MARSRDLADVVDDIVHVLVSATQVQRHERQDIDVDLDPTDPRAVKAAAAVIRTWEHPRARRWAWRLEVRSSQLIAGSYEVADNPMALALPSSAELATRVASGEIAVRTMMALARHDVADVREFLTRHREGSG